MNIIKRKTQVFCLFMIISFQAIHAQQFQTVLQQIEENSTTLSTLRDQMEAQKLGNRTGIYLPNPEVEFNYLWGSPSAIGNRTDISITQSFDFPTAYGHRSKLSELENANVDILYKSERIKLLLRAKQVCIELVYYNALAKEYATRSANAERVAETFQTRFDKGDANIIENNKAQMNLTTVRNEMKRIEMERTSLLSELQMLNGGKSITNYETAFGVSQLRNTDYSVEILPEDFASWYEAAESKNPVLQYVRGQIGIGQRQVKLNNALGLPKFTAGYMSENVVDERFQGVTLGISIPLWENKNRVKQAKAQVKAAETTLEDTKVQFYNKLQNLFMKASGLQENVLNYRNALSSYSNEALLKKALDSGEISLLNYLLEIEYYYDAMNKVLEAERDFNLSMAELSAVEL